MSEEPTDSAVGAQPSQPEHSASASGYRDSDPETAGKRPQTASTAQSSATRNEDGREAADDHSSATSRGGEPKDSKDSEPPQAVSDIEPSKITPKHLTVSWPAANDNVGVIGYRIWLNGFEVATTARTKARLRWFNDDNGEHVVQVRAVDAAGNQSRSSPTLVVERPSPEPTDTPSPPPSDTPTPRDQSSTSSQDTDQSFESPGGTATDQKSTAEDEDS